mmetsp:Transcript_36997/g.87908  ORF Transcript_36997/g.87908 Transcript_36997/m.87908 type:complete len:420 (+) Transcript_36997:223-1482(+)
MSGYTNLDLAARHYTDLDRDENEEHLHRDDGLDSAAGPFSCQRNSQVTLPFEVANGTRDTFTRHRRWRWLAGLVVVGLIVATVVLISLLTKNSSKSNSARRAQAPDTASSYKPVAHVAGHAFLDWWDFYAGDDPTNGEVRYVTRESAQAENLTYYSETEDLWYIKADSENRVPEGEPGRRSVRLESRALFRQGLFVLDAAHVPTGCGSWPAFWMFADPWPQTGEIDVIEGVHESSGNSIALHTAGTCSMRTVDRASFTGAWKEDGPNRSAVDCRFNATSQPFNQGCSVDAGDGTMGAGFNAAGGGVWAMVWSSAEIRVHFFPRGSVPSDLAESRPTPSAWGLPVARFAFGRECEGYQLGPMKLVVSLTFCGDWAGTVWGAGGCASKAGNHTCEEFVRENPSAFREAYWGIKHLKVFTER